MEKLKNTKNTQPPSDSRKERPFVETKPQKNYRKIAIGIFLSIIIILAGLKSYSEYQINQRLNPSTDTLTPSPQSTNTHLPIVEIEDVSVPSEWKTYTNIALGYSFKYPANYTVKENCANPPGTLCIRSSNYKVDTKPIMPGDGGENTEIVGIRGFNLNINIPDTKYAFISDNFCHPGGPNSIWECNELVIHTKRYAARLMGALRSIWNLILIEDTIGTAEFTASFDPKLTDSSKQVTMKIVSTFIRNKDIFTEGKSSPNTEN